ncbi:hypothetical protein Syun_012679 [Stephania yunnanensis]|uniref:Uncharacterized protein n=1 Tax=Stephania yunnanensis TaxID=152371 RepID=A0AAP0K0P3_9MAGN
MDIRVDNKRIEELTMSMNGKHGVDIIEGIRQSSGGAGAAIEAEQRSARLSNGYSAVVGAVAADLGNDNTQAEQRQGGNDGAMIAQIAKRHVGASVGAIAVAREWHASVRRRSARSVRCGLVTGGDRMTPVRWEVDLVTGGGSAQWRAAGVLAIAAGRRGHARGAGRAADLVQICGEGGRLRWPAEVRSGESVGGAVVGVQRCKQQCKQRGSVCGECERQMEILVSGEQGQQPAKARKRAEAAASRWHGQCNHQWRATERTTASKRQKNTMKRSSTRKSTDLKLETKL